MGSWQPRCSFLGGAVSHLFLSVQNLSSSEMLHLGRSPGKTAGSAAPDTALEQVNPDL